MACSVCERQPLLCCCCCCVVGLVRWSGEVVRYLYPASILFVRVCLSRRTTFCGYMLGSSIVCCALHDPVTSTLEDRVASNTKSLMRVASSAHCGDACSRPQHMDVRFISNKSSSTPSHVQTFKYAAVELWLPGALRMCRISVIGVNSFHLGARVHQKGCVSAVFV